MAALGDRRADCLVPLRNLRPEQLGPLLEEEIEEWRALHWDFRASADLVRRFSGMNSLEGFALLAGPSVAGLAYSVADDEKGLIGDLYVARSYRTFARENALLEALLESMWSSPALRRIEAQLVLLSASGSRHPPPLAPAFRNILRTYPRAFLEIPLAAIIGLRPREPAGAAFAGWSENQRGEAARLIAAAYAGHVDAEINDQYRSAGSALRFLSNIVQYPGCGAFFAPASFVAFEAGTGTACGLSLASKVADDAGHITQVCVAPQRRGAGLGYELVRRSLTALAAHGAKTVSLTVTASNTPATRLYERMGFICRREFWACVWERLGAAR